MNITFRQLVVRARQTVETVEFSPIVSFFHGPVSTGKSTIARLIDYCLGGTLEQTPAIRQEFVAAELLVNIGAFEARFERGAEDKGYVRVTWFGNGEMASVNAPLEGGDVQLFGPNVFNLSDLIFRLAGVAPIKVRRSKLDPDSPLVRLSFRDLMWYCYLVQDHLDSSFYRLEDTFRRLKSQDAMRFVTGLHSERMNDLDIALIRASEAQRAKREAVVQIRAFMDRFNMGTEMDVMDQANRVQDELAAALSRSAHAEQTRSVNTHIVEPLREQLRMLSAEIGNVQAGIADIDVQLSQREALRAELVSAKVKTARAEQAGSVLAGAIFEQCPQCGDQLLNRNLAPNLCTLCCSPQRGSREQSSKELEVLRRDLNERMDELADTIERYRRARAKEGRVLEGLVRRKRDLDEQLTTALSQYDNAYIASIRSLDRDVAKLQERLESLNKLQEMPKAIANLEDEAAKLQSDIDRLKDELARERVRLRSADTHIGKIADRFLRIMQDIGFPGVSEADQVVLDPRNWQPFVRHGDQQWTFYDAGSGGKKTLFNVCYALAVHEVAAEEGLPLPTFLIIDSPTKNISDDENPELVGALYRKIYSLATREGQRIQFVLIDSDLVEPEFEIADFCHRRLAGQPGEPRLIPYYEGP